MQGGDREARTKSSVIFPSGALHMDESVLADQEELTYNSSVQTQDVDKKTCWERWMMGTNGERERVKEIHATCTT